MRKFQNENGFTLVLTIIALSIMSILGLSIIGVTVSNFKMVKIDSRNQNAYYIAEAGANYIIDQINTKAENYSGSKTSEEFFRYIENLFTNSPITYDKFEENDGEQPEAVIRVKGESIDGNTRDYKIESIGKIGESRRTVISIISITWTDLTSSDLILNTNKFIFQGNNLNSPGKTILISGQDQNSMNGGSSIIVKNIYFKELKNGVISGKSYGDKNNSGDIYLDGNAKILDSGRTMYGNVHTNGDFIVTGGVNIHGDLYVGGKFEVTGGSIIYGNVYVKDDLKIKGGATIHGNVYAYKGIDANGGGRIKGDLNVVGNSKLVNITVEGFSNIEGNLELGWTPSFMENLNYTGTLTTPSNFHQNIIDKCQWVESIPALKDHDYSFHIPNCTVLLKEDDWFADNGYTIKGNESGAIPHGTKMLVDNYKNESWQKVTGEVVIVSKGDIILRGDKNFTGALIAPYGKIKYSGGGSFDGVIISQNEINLTGGGTTVNLKSVEEFFGSKVPIVTTCNNSGGDSSRGNVKLTIKEGIREK